MNQLIDSPILRWTLRVTAQVSVLGVRILAVEDYFDERKIGEVQAGSQTLASLDRGRER